MRFARQAAPILFLVLAFALPVMASASLLPSEIIPAACHCDGTNGQPMSAPDFGCVFQTIQNVMNFAVMISFLFLTFAIAYAGFMWMINSVNPEGKEKARALLTNTLIGILIVISAWILVDFVMKKIYNDAEFGPWNEILYANSGTQCLKVKPATGSTASTNSGGLTAQEYSKPSPTKDGALTTAVSNQNGDRSAKLVTLLSCVANYVPANVGRITSISDSNGGVQCYVNHPDWKQCTADGQQNCCYHAKNSCHYGGSASKGGECGVKSFAVDFGDGDPNTPNASWLKAAAQSCNANYVLQEGNHLHVSVGAQCGCN